MATAVIGTMAIKLTAETAKFEKQLKTASGKLDVIAKAAKRVAQVSAVAFGAGSIAIAKFITLAADAGETTAKLGEVFKAQTPKVEAFTQNLAREAGRSRFELDEMVSSIGAVVKPMLGSADAAADMATQLTALAVDLASFNNLTDDEALIALRAGLVGSTEPMLKFGVVMLQANLQAFALSQGIKGNVKDMTDAQKANLRFQFILSKTTDAQGDAVRTSLSFANQLKAVKGSVADLATELGQSLMPTATALIGVLRRAIDFFRNLSPATKAFAAKALLLGTALAGVVAGLATMVAILPAIISGLALIKVGFIAFAGLAGAAIGPVILAMVAIGAAIFGVIAGVGALKDAWAGDLGGIRTFTLEVVATIQKAWNDMLNFMDKKFGKTIDKIGATVTNFIAFVSGVSPEEAFAIEQERKRAGGLLSDPGAALATTGGAIAGGVGDIAGVVNDLVIKPLGKSAKAGFDAIFGDLLKSLKLPAKQAGEAMATVKPPAKDLKKVIGEVVKAKKKEKTASLSLAETLTKNVNAAVDSFVENLKLSGKGVGASLSAGIKTVLGVFGSAVAAGGDNISAAMQGAAEGFKQGGPMGAIIGALAQLATETESFKAIMDIVNNLLGKVVKVLDDLLKPLIPMINSLAALIGVFADIFVLVSGLTSTIDVFGDVTGKVAEVILNVAKTIRDVFNGIIDALIKIVKKVLFGAAERKAVKALRRSRIKIEDFRTPEEIEKTDDLSEAMDDAAESTTNFSDTVRDISEQLSNVPAGLLVNLRRTQSTAREVTATGLEPDQGVRAVRGGDTFNIEVADTEELARRLDERQSGEDAQFNRSSSKQGTFGTARQGS